jgi:hypothetical protein
LHSGGDSEDEAEEMPEDAEEEQSKAVVVSRSKNKSSRRAVAEASSTTETKKQENSDARNPKNSGVAWLLPSYLRPFRRLLLSVAGPAVSAAKKAPTVHVSTAPAADTVPEFLQKALNQPELADVEFILRDSDGKAVSVYAHRLILAAASEHFRKQFTFGGSEAFGVMNGRCIVDLDDWVSPRPLLWMLAYLYQGFDPHSAQLVAARLAVSLEQGVAATCSRPVTGSKSERKRLPKLIDEAAVGEDLCCLLRLSDVYGISHLKQWTEQRLQALLNPDNLIAISTHAFHCNGKQLLDVSVYHMQLLYGELAKKPDWENLEPAIQNLVLNCDDTAAESSL